MDGCDIDLCELLSSIPLEVKPSQPTKEDLEIAGDANRLSAYDNMSYTEKLDFVLRRREQDTVCENDDLLRRKLFDELPTRSKESSEAQCRMCGLFGKRRTADQEDDTYIRR